MSDWMELACARGVVVRALKLAIVVGTILAVINHGDKILLGTLSAGDIAKILVTFIVPYCVSTVSSVGALRSRAAANA